eukprot:jgi/Hompol1/942/HPOL_001580-RA
MADYRLNQECRQQFLAFIAGFKSVIAESWLKIFSPVELQWLMSGEDLDFDPKELRACTVYQGGYFDLHGTIRNLWSVLAEFTPGDRSAFLKFVTSCSKPPVGGFKYLDPPFTIAFVDGGEEPASTTVFRPFSQLGNLLGLGKDKERLPTASTCFNLLKLPAFSKRSTLKAKLLYAIHSGTGFELS